MKYELWDIVCYGHGEPPIPFTKLASSDEFGIIYEEFKKTMKQRPCVIVASREKEEEKLDTQEGSKGDNPKIYESPDGEIVYERDFGDYDLKNRRRIK